MDNKLSIKFELGLYEQTYKFRESDYMKNMADAEKLVDGKLMEEVLKNFSEMHRAKNESLGRLVKMVDEENFSKEKENTEQE